MLEEYGLVRKWFISYWKMNTEKQQFSQIKKSSHPITGWLDAL
ncbi:hypothetical protein [Myroides fluvii]|nr:hypothetical protein [Myroides fluvii]